MFKSIIFGLLAPLVAQAQAESNHSRQWSTDCKKWHAEDVQYPSDIKMVIWRDGKKIEDFYFPISVVDVEFRNTHQPSIAARLPTKDRFWIENKKLMLLPELGANPSLVLGPNNQITYYVPHNKANCSKTGCVAENGAPLKAFDGENVNFIKPKYLASLIHICRESVSEQRWSDINTAYTTAKESCGMTFDPKKPLNQTELKMMCSEFETAIVPALKRRYPAQD